MSLCEYCGADSPSRYCCLSRASEARRQDDLNSACMTFPCEHEKKEYGHCEYSDFKHEEHYTIQTMCRNNTNKCRRHFEMKMERIDLERKQNDVRKL
jgi:hypothetical protein